MNSRTLARMIFYPLVLFLVTFIFKDQLVAAFLPHNGFDLTDSLVNTEEIHHGGPAKDGIPAIEQPVFVSASEAAYMASEDRILGLFINGVAKAYPVKILNYHEIVNDFFKDKAVVLTYCPLCGSGVAYSAVINGKHTTFGVSGLLYNSDVLLYDRETESLWSQLLAKAISGPYKGAKLQMLALTQTSWQDWQKSYPDTLVLSLDTGYQRDYSRSPYGNYEQSRSMYFPVSPMNNAYHPKEYVLGLKLKNQTKVYPFAELAKMRSPFRDNFAQQSITVFFNAQHRTGKILDSYNKEIPTVTSFWFAWMAFYPDSIVFRANAEPAVPFNKD